jgi:hypothetical protein
LTTVSLLAHPSSLAVFYNWFAIGGTWDAFIVCWAAVGIDAHDLAILLWAVSAPTLFLVIVFVCVDLSLPTTTLLAIFVLWTAGRGSRAIFPTITIIASAAAGTIFLEHNSAILRHPTWFFVLGVDRGLALASMRGLAVAWWLFGAVTAAPALLADALTDAVFETGAALVSHAARRTSKWCHREHDAGQANSQLNTASGGP